MVADLQGAADGAVANSGATLTDSEDIEPAGRQGRELVADLEGRGHADRRASTSTANRLCQVIYTGRH